MSLTSGVNMLRVTLAAFVALVGFMAIAPSAGAAVEPGVVHVKGTTFDTVVTVNLAEDLGQPGVSVPGRAGEKGWSLREILLFAQEATDDAFVLSSLAKNPVLSREGKNNISVSRNRVAKPSNDSKLPVYFLDDDGGTLLAEPGGRITEFANSYPEVFVSRSTFDVRVDITKPTGTVRLKAGQKQTFKATASSSTGGEVKLTWKIDGIDRQSGTAANNGTFTYEFAKEGTFQVQAFASSAGTDPVFDAVNVIVGKAKQKPKPKKKQPKDDEDSEQESPAPYYDDPGYPEYGDPYGDYPGTSEPSQTNPSTPDPERKKKKEQPAPEETGDTVSGQLINPEQIATVLPSTGTPATGAEEAAPAEEASDGGFGLSKGMGTALGIGALLGLGGLVEAGAFSGAFRRFRP